MNIRRGTVEDIDNLLANRMEFLQVVRNCDIKFHDSFRDDTLEFMKEHLSDDTLGVWIAEESDEIAAVAMVCYYNLLPSISNKTGRTGYIQNVYTKADFRGKGLATELVNRIIKEAKERNVGTLFLHASDMGRSVYERIGFGLLTSDMSYKIEY